VHSNSKFPLQGVIGVVAESADELQLACRKGLQCVELRADLLLDNGFSEQQLFDLVKAGKDNGLGVLFTLRHPTHGGTFQGDESARVAMSLRAVESGADLFDLEWGTAAAEMLPTDAPPMILSYHNLNAMPDEAELRELTVQMEATGARAIKVVPTASGVADALAMLQWVGQGNGTSARIGFAMGKTAACSRILTTVCGGEVTYASFGAPVAPGQIDIDELLSVYRVGELDRTSEVTAVCIDGDPGHERVLELNNSYKGSNRVAVGFGAAGKNSVEECSEILRVTDIVS
jgi:3-dehydroquinate dehydratase type I